MNDVYLQLPYPPSINSYYKRKRNGGVYISDEGRNFRQEVIKQFKTDLTLNSRISVEVLLFPPDHRKRDLDNVLKSLLDSLTHARVYSDDSLIDSLTIKRKSVIKKTGLCLVNIKIIE